MKNISITILIISLLFSCEEKPNPKTETPLTTEKLIESVINKKFSGSSKSQFISVKIMNNNLEVKIKESSYGFDSAAIDVAVALFHFKRATNHQYDKVKIIGLKKSFSFSQKLFEQYTTGKINDAQFLQKGIFRKN